MEKTKKAKLTAVSLALMIFTAVYGFGNVPLAFYQMGYGAIPWYILSAIVFFLPFSLMVTEFGSSFKKERGGIYSWMEKSVGPGFALTGTLMWYMSWVTWFVAVGNRILVPIANVVFGSSDIINETPTWLMSILAIIIMGIVTLASMNGIGWIKRVASIGGIASVSLNFILIIAAIILMIHQHGIPATSLTWSALWTTPNPNLQPVTFVTLIAFLVYAIFAYAGVESVGGLVDETEKPERNFPRGILIATAVIMIGYSLMILLNGFVINYAKDWLPMMKDGTLTQGNLTYVMMQQLGEHIGSAFGLSASGITLMGTIFARYVGISMLLALTGAFFTLIFSPLKQLMEGAPEDMWPGKLGKVENGVPRTAMKWQFFIVSAFLIMNMVISLINAGAADQFFLVLTNMGNVASSLPYVFIVIAYIKYKQNDSIEKPFVVMKNKTFAIVVAWISAFVIIMADLFTMIQPVIDHFQDPEGVSWSSVFTNILSMAAGPIVFGIFAWWLMKNYKKKHGN
ncbi:glutamate/gamma-aminobutyrate family transporter YjeM [Lactovum odontotermitis]